jgi:hypothetical protein
MNFMDNQTCTKNEIKLNFLSFFKTQDISHLATQKLKEIKQNPGETIHEYDKRFKYLLSQILYEIDEKLLVQWYATRLLSPNLGITKEIMYRGPQVLDMEYREPDRLEHGPGGPILSFFSASTLSTATTSITSAWSCNKDGSCSMR